MSDIIEHTDKWIQTRTQAIYAVPPTFGTGGGGKVGVDLSLLEMTLTPVKAGNTIVLEYYIFGSSQQQSIELGFVLRRNGVNLTNTSDFADNYYAINSLTFQDGSPSTSVPQIIKVQLYDRKSLDIESTYTIAARHTTSNFIGTINFYLNRVQDTPASDVETGVTSTKITEIDE